LKYFLDTNICVYVTNERSAAATKRLRSCNTEDVGISIITVAELRYGADKSHAAEKAHNALNNFLTPLQILEFDEKAATTYGFIRAQLEKKGTPIGPLDMLIGAHALSVGAIMVTGNTKEFRRIPGLVVEDWTR